MEEPEVLSASTKPQIEPHTTIYAWDMHQLVFKRMLKSVGLNANLCTKILRDTTKSMGSPKRTMPFWRLRDTADLLGIPPVFLVKNSSDNREFIERYQEDYLSRFSVYESNGLRGALDIIRHYAANSTLPQHAKKHLFNTITEAEQAVLQRKEEIARKFKVTFHQFDSFFNKFVQEINHNLDPDNRHDFAGRLFIDTLSDMPLHGTFNFTKIRYQGEVWATMWLAISRTSNIERNKPSVTELIDRISDLLQFSVRRPWYLPLYSSQTDLFSWHSHRVADSDETKKELLDALSSRDDVGTMIPLFSGFSQFNFDIDPELQELITWIVGEDMEDEQHLNQNDKKENSEIGGQEQGRASRSLTLDTLYTAGVFSEGDFIQLLNPYILPDKNWQKDEKHITAQLLLSNGRWSVRWVHDGQIYSISALTRILLNKPKAHLDGNMYWTLDGAHSLYEISKNLGPHNTTQSHLF